MKRGSWHQCGFNTHKLVAEQLGAGQGVGVVISPRDLTFGLATEAAAEYRSFGASILCDPQYYFHEFNNSQLSSYPADELRRSLSSQAKISATELTRLAAALVKINSEVGAHALIAPAVPYEAGQPGISILNKKLFEAAKKAGNELGIPTYGTAIIARSAVQSESTFSDALDQITALDADGWYYGFEFEEDRIPSSVASVFRCGSGALTLAATGRPLIHAFAGPMALLSLGFGATGAAIGPSQNLWRFDRSRGKRREGAGGGGNAPPRFFSELLWGTIIYPDETQQLPPEVATSILTQSVYSTPTKKNLPWTKWDSKKHLVSVIGEMVARIAETATPVASANAALHVLDSAVAAHHQIRGARLVLADKTAVYQAAWAEALRSLLTSRKDDYDFIGQISA